jgi:hypothetical protein
LGHSCHPSLSFSAPRTFQEWRDRATPLASHIFVSRRVYQKKSDTKNEKRHYSSALLSWQQACDFGLRGDLEEWLEGAISPETLICEQEPFHPKIKMIPQEVSSIQRTPSSTS